MIFFFFFFTASFCAANNLAIFKQGDKIIYTFSSHIYKNKIKVITRALHKRTFIKQERDVYITWMNKIDNNKNAKEIYAHSSFHKLWLLQLLFPPLCITFLQKTNKKKRRERVETQRERDGERKIESKVEKKLVRWQKTVHKLKLRREIRSTFLHLSYTVVRHTQIKSTCTD